MKVKVISILEDNYMYLVIEEDTKRAIAVDPAVPHRLLEILRREGLSLTAVLTTHHHCSSEVQGENDPLEKSSAASMVKNNKSLPFSLPRLQFGSINVRCLFTPCHTSGHMCYFVWEDDCADAPAVFTGDTLFVAGCGKFFEGTAEQMHRNLTEVLGSLPKDTKVFCGHEYTIKNLKFALKVEPGNEKVKQMLSWARARDDDDKPTVPSTLSEEFEYNPFLRLSEESVQTFTGKRDPIEVLRVLRKEKDNFKKPKERAAAPHALLALEWGLLRP
uniref:Hydroxyacylglutathione hydrolase like n=1 Tax=Lepisosteus oculatus TaxID=7918 RepID=W5MCR8_LEPOC